MLLWRWLKNAPLIDPVERRIAPLLQLVIVALIVTPLFEIVAQLSLGGEVAVGVLALTLLFQAIMVYSLRTLRRGHFKRATTILLVVLFLAVARGMTVVDMDRTGEILLAFLVPLIIAGLLLNRLTLALTLIGSSVVVVLEALSSANPQRTIGIAVFFIIYSTLVSFLLDLLGSTLRTELAASQARSAELERMQHALEASNERLADVNERLITTLKSIGDAVITTDKNGRVVLMNDVAQGLVGWTQAEAQGRPLDEVFQIVNEHTRETVESPVTKVLREGNIVGLANHTILLSRDGREIPIDDSGAPVRHPDGSIIGVVLVFRDITERHRIEREREQLLERERDARIEAERANAAKMQFLGMISHELRTPLTSIKGFADSLLAEDVVFGPEEQRQFLGIINEEADKLTELVDQLLDVSSLQSGNMKITVAPRKLPDILNTAAVQLQLIATQHELVIDLADELPPVMADASRIAQVCVNLVANAVKFSPPASQIRLRADASDDLIHVSVQDQGVGIAPEHHEAIFEPFRQAERRRGGTDGAGLGLAICKGIVEAHGGRIWVADTAASGTTITFTLPVAE